MFTLAGEPNGSARARALLDFETKIATVHWTRIDSRDATKIYNKMSVAELHKLAPGFDFATYIKGLGANVTDVLVAQPSAFKGIAAAIAGAKLQVLKDALLIRSLDGFADDLPDAIAKESLDRKSTRLNSSH